MWKMIDSAAAVPAWLRTVIPFPPARRTRKGNSVAYTGRFRGCRSGAAGRRNQTRPPAGVVESII
jgi:hypothetical protein